MEMFSNEINMRLSQELDSLMSVMHFQINRAISAAINDRFIPEIQSIMGSLSSSHRDTESGLLGNSQTNNDQPNGLKTKRTKKDSRTAFDLSDTKDLSPYNNAS